MELPPRLLQALLDVRFFNEATLTESVPEGVDPKQFHRWASQMRDWDATPISEVLERYREIPPEIRSIALVRRLLDVRYHELTANVRQLIEELDLSPDVQDFWALTRATLDARSGFTARAIEQLEELTNSADGSTPLGRYIVAWSHQRLGRLYRTSGDFRRALQALEAAERSLPDLTGGSSHRRRVAYDRASLFWASGQLRRALELHTNERNRSVAEREGDVAFLVRSHLSAAKCAIDLGATTKANRELGSAKELLDEMPGRFPMSEAYLALYSAELDALFGNDEESFHLFEYAIEQFEDFDPPFYPGVLDAKIGLVRFQLERGNFKKSFLRLAELLEEAERKECMEARTRLLAYQARLLLRRGEDPERLRAAYEDLATREHLMNNPHLTMLMFADLYMFAREYLSIDEQRHWLERLRGLRRVLEKSCFEDLYRDYVLERYRQEVEGPIDDLGLDLSDGEF